MNDALIGVLALMLIGAGFVAQGFSLWQLDLQFVSRMWGRAEDNIRFYQDLLGNGYKSYSQMPWTINVELFPNMTAGVAYDILMIMNFGSWFLTAVGVYLIHGKMAALKTALRSKVAGHWRRRKL